MSSNESVETGSPLSWVGKFEYKGGKDGEMKPPQNSDVSSMEKEHTHNSQHMSKNTIEDHDKKPASCMQQVRALVRKNFLNKIRTPISTFLELLSPAIFMLILVLGYNLSEERYRDAGTYSQLVFDLPNPVITSSILNILGVSDVVNTLGDFKIDARRILHPGLTKLNILLDKNDDFSFDYDESNISFFDEYYDETFRTKHINRISRMLQNFNETEIESGFDDDISGYEDVYNSFEDLRRELRRLLRSPMPIPSLPQYLAISQYLSSQFNPNELDLVYQTSDYIRRWGNLLTLGTMHLSPRGEVTKDFIQYLEDSLNIVNITSSEVLEDRPNATSVLIRVHDNFDAATQYVMNNLEERTFVHVNFDEDDEDFKYTIRMNSTTLPNTNLITRWIQIGLNSEYQKYYFSGHLTIQRTVNEFAIWRLSNDSHSIGSREPQSNQLFTLPMPTPSYSQNPFFTSVGYLLGLVIAMSFLYPVSRLIKAIVEEKETRMKETLLILGVRPFALWLSWLISALISSLIIAIFVTLTLSRVMIYSSTIYLFIYILLFALSTMSFGFFISAFFSRANLAAIVGPVALFVTLLPRWIFFGTNRYENVNSKKWASLLPCTAFAFGADILSDYEYSQIGVQRSNLQDGKYNFSTSLGFLFFDIILYIGLGWYLEQILPRQYGVPKKWYFFLTTRYWKGICPFSKNDNSQNNIVNRNDVSRNDVSRSDEDNIERGYIEAQLEIMDLVKIYDPNKPPAINELNLSMYDSEITCLLGHNGAGKTSTISVLTGIYPPTSGDCVIYGNSVLHEMERCRQSMGLCPQQNVLFNNLTVLENLRVFERIKGVSFNDVEERAREVGLGEFFDTRAANLSGGNKRKLQLAIALVGEPKLVLLDEPTSGMDPYSRRATWDLLRQKRKGRIILLTTHFMDEAEVLADRVAILKHGSLQCCGSVIFLKERFGLGYNITLITDKVEDDPSTPTVHHRDTIMTMMEKTIPGTRFIRESARELVFRFPPGSEHMFPSLFKVMENDSSFYNVTSYGISDTSLEEVFLELADDDDNNENQEALNTDSSELIHTFTNLNTWAQIYLLLWKRITVQKRDRKGLFFQILLPVILICLVLMVLLIEVPIEGSPLTLTPELYNTSGTGATIGNQVLVAGEELASAYSFVTALQGNYPSVNFELQPDLKSSDEMSEFILEGLNIGRREFNFGSIIIGDTIKTTLNVDWDEIKSQGNDIIEQIQGAVLSGLVPDIDVINFIADLDVTTVLENLNSTLISQNFTGVGTLLDVLTDENSRIELLNQTISFFNPTFNDVDMVNTFFNNSENILGFVNQTLAMFNLTSIEVIDLVFSTSDTIEIEGNGWSLVLTEDQVLNLLNNDLVYESYDLMIDVPISIMHNTSSSHSVAAFTQTYYDYLYKNFSETSKASLLATNYPLPLTSQQSTEIRTVLSIIASILLAIPFNYIPAAFAVFLVKERACKSKHLQLVSGVDMLSYWISTYIFDFCLYMILAVLSTLVFLCFGTVSVVFTGTVAASFCTFIMIVGYGCSSLPFAYLLSRFFDNPSNAQISIMIIFFITGFVAVNAYFIMDNIETTRYIAKGLRPLFRFWPAYNLGEGFLNLATNYWQSQILPDAPSPFEFDSCGRQIFLLFALAPPYFLWLILLEYSSDGGSGGQFGKLLRAMGSAIHNIHNDLSGFTKIAYDNEDDDVAEERAVVKERKLSFIKYSPVVIHELWKTFPKESFAVTLSRKFCSYLIHCKDAKVPKVAVSNLSLHVEKGITMGLLGVNGAGKTTTMGIVTGDITPTCGEAYVAGYDVTGVTKDGVQLARKNIGFCPQVDPLLDLMTARETLKMFGQLRGIPSEILDNIVDSLLDKLTLTAHADKISAYYSGGNKRKLSLGVALIGNPKVLFIDEASSGMDPATRRKMWDLISDAGKDRAVIITTHSMEEAEALCNKITIMINGRMRCLGGVQHLKQKFLGGYMLTISCKFNATQTAIDETEVDILDAIPEAQLSEKHGPYLKFDIPSIGVQNEEKGKSLGNLFTAMQELVENPDSIVISYSISQCTLEQIFINLVREEGVPEETS